jgi:flagellar hook-associated protein 2
VAISSIGSAFGSGTSTAAVDVADIVSRLMSAENRPLDAINQKIASKELVISELGTIKTKAATLLDAVKVFENPNTYINTSATSDNTKVLNVSASNTASVGSYVVNVSQVAQRSLYNITGFASATDLLRTTSNNGFQMTVGNTIYSSNGSKTVNGVTTENAITAIGTSPTAESLKNWINNLRSVTQVSATLAQMDNNQWALFISGDNEGANYDFSITGLQTDLVISGFVTENDVVSLDATNGFSLTHDGITYKTHGTGANVSAITGTGSNGAILLRDIRTWIENLSSASNLNLMPSVELNGDLLIAQGAGNGSVINVSGINGSIASITSEPLLNISSTQRQRTESALFTFSDLKTGDSLTIAGLTMTAKQDLTSTEAATAFNTMRDGVLPNIVTSLVNGERSTAVSGQATIDISNVVLPTAYGTYKLTSLGSVLTMTQYVNDVATNSSSINIITSGTSNLGANPPTVLFESALNGKTDLNFGALGSFSVNTVLAATSPETATEIASKILNAVDSAGQVTANAWVSVPNADWANTAKTNLGGTDSYKAVITTTGNTLIRIAASTTTSLGAVTGYTGLTGMDDGLVTEMAFTGTAAQLSAALKTLEAKSPDGLGKVAVHIVPSNISVRVDSISGEISFYKTVTTAETWTSALTSAKSVTHQLATANGTLTGHLSNVTSAAEQSFITSKILIGTGLSIGGREVSESRYFWMDGPEAGLEFFWGRNANGLQFSSLRDATAVPKIITGSNVQSEIRSWDISRSSAMELFNGRQITFSLRDKNDPTKIDTVIYTNTSASPQSISTVLANLKSYFDNNSIIDIPYNDNEIFSIDGTKRTAAGTKGLFSEFNFTYSLAADNRSGSFTFTGKNVGAITDGSPASFQIRGINLYTNWDTGAGEPNSNSTTQDYVALKSSGWHDQPNTASAYLVEYNVAANSTLMRRELSLPSPGVVIISDNTDPNVVRALNFANFSGTVSGYTTGLNGSQLTFTSTQPLTNVSPNIAYSFTPASVSSPPFSAPVITEGGGYALATALLAFPTRGLNQGDSVTVGGLSFTASRAASSAEIASAFANLANGASTGSGTAYGSYSGAISGFSSGAVVNTNQVLFTQIDSGTANSIASLANIASSANIALVIAGTGLTVDKFTTAQDALFTVDDKSYTKTTNTVGDVISGLTLQLTGDAGIANVSVVLGEDKSEVSIKSFMTAYNDLIKSANVMNANSSNSEKPGTFANSPTSLSFISEIKRKVADGATYNIGKTDSTGRPYTMSLSSLGLDYQLDGTLSYSATSLASAKSQGLRDKLLSGLRIGYSSSTDNLADLLTSQMSSIGVLTNQTSSGAESLSSLNKEKDRLEERLNRIQAGYIAQYSNLNKLLFQLNSTSQSLTSALDGLKNA